MPSLGAAEEVNEENDGYDYDEDFEVGYSCMSYSMQPKSYLKEVLAQEQFCSKLQGCVGVLIQSLENESALNSRFD